MGGNALHWLAIVRRGFFAWRDVPELQRSVLTCRDDLRVLRMKGNAGHGSRVGGKFSDRLAVCRVP